MPTASSPTRRPARAPALVFVLCALSPVAVACGERSSLFGEALPSQGAPDAGALAHDADASFAPDSAQAADAGDADAMGAGDVAFPSTDLGNVTITSGAYVNGSVQTLVAQATFFKSVPATGCTVVPLAECTLTTCTGVIGGGPGNFASAGAISVTGGSYPVVIEPGTSGFYSTVADGGPVLFRGGETMTVTGSGSAVPPFTASLVAPTQVVVLSPALGALISRSAPLGIAWSGGSAGRLVVDIDTASQTVSLFLECRLAVSAGTAVIPAIALGALPAGGATLSISTTSEVTLGDGPWSVAAFVQTTASDGSGQEYRGNILLQ